MLTFFLPKLKENKIVGGLRAFLYSEWYLFYTALLMAISCIFTLELPVFYLYLLAVLCTVLLCDDCYPLAIMACCGYMTFSATNNPASYLPDTLFSDPVNFCQFLGIAIVIGVALIARLIFEFVCLKRERGLPKLTFGYVALGVALMLGGLFSPFYSGKTVLFALLEITCLSVFYFYLFFTVDWEKRKKEDGLMLLLAMGMGIALETIGMYFQPEALYYLKKEGTFHRSHLFLGWGNYNNVGGMMLLCIPAPFYFALKRNKGWVFTLLGGAFFGAVVITQSRASILIASVLYLACTVILFVKAKKGERLQHLFVYLALLAVVGTLFVIFFDRIAELFFGIVNSGTSDSGRWTIYKNGLLQFLDFPIFGNGFYECTGTQWGEAYLPADRFLPPRYHNTIVQLLATGGLVAFGAYVYHRVQTAFLFFKRPTTEKTFLGLCILGLLMASLLDCHLFNFGPGLVYSILLLFVEKNENKQEQPPAEQVE